VFSDDDFGLAELREIALGFPSAFEKISWGRPVFCAPKMFAMYGGSCKQTGEIVTFPYSLLVKVDESDRLALEQDGRFFYPAYMGPYGWLGLDLAAAAGGDKPHAQDVDWVEVAELVDASYRLIASRRLVKELDKPR
jgi:hypothetical protein